VGKPDSTDDEVKTADATAAESEETRADAKDDIDELDTAVDDADELDDDDDDDSDDDEVEGDPDDQSPQTALFWADVEIDPIEIALPSGTGLTLRHYRSVEDDDGDPTEEAVLLAHRGKLHLFKTREGLLEFIQSDAPHDLAELESWAQVQRRVAVTDLIAIDEDRYELDLVVENLRGGHDMWEPDVLIPAGEVARDIAFACELDEVLAALAPGSPLDDLDEGLRDGGFMARRRLKKVGAEQASIGWRSIIGKITAAVKWHD